MTTVILDVGDPGVVFIPGVGYRPNTVGAPPGATVPACVLACEQLPGYADLPTAVVTYHACGSDLYVAGKLGEQPEVLYAAAPAPVAAILAGPPALRSTSTPVPAPQPVPLLCCTTSYTPPPQPPAAVPLPGNAVLLIAAIVGTLIWMKLTWK